MLLFSNKKILTNSYFLEIIQQLNNHFSKEIYIKYFRNNFTKKFQTNDSTMNLNFKLRRSLSDPKKYITLVRKLNYLTCYFVTSRDIITQFVNSNMNR